MYQQCMSNASPIVLRQSDYRLLAPQQLSCILARSRSGQPAWTALHSSPCNGDKLSTEGATLTDLTNKSAGTYGLVRNGAPPLSGQLHQAQLDCQRALREPIRAGC